MPTNTPVTDQDGNKPYRSSDESLANSNVNRPAPLEADRIANVKPSEEKQAESDSRPGQSQ